MSALTHTLVVNNIKLSVDASVKEAFSVAKQRLKRIGITALDMYVYRRSVDARHKDDVKFVYSIAARCTSVPKNSVTDITPLTDSNPVITHGDQPLSAPPVVVGTGPCGLFAALLLAEHGYAPIVIERGGSIKERSEAVQRFSNLGILDTESNIQFGAGGAGTFSDGKLVTRINDPLGGYVLDRFVNFGASDDIKYIAKPHIGTDVLTGIVDAMLNRITELGGTVMYHTRLESFTSKSGNVTTLNTTNGDINAGAVILAIGHSARDTYEYLINRGIAIECKPFSVGMRIEHLTSDIDRALYGNFADHPALGHAEYNLSYDTKNRGVYTFCMCPGGEVVAAASEEGSVVVNGMSRNARSGRNSNSAVVCSVFREDYGATPMKAIEFQRKIERTAYASAGSDYSAPIITVGDFLSDQLMHEPTRVTPTYMNSKGVKLASPDTYLPEFVTKQMKCAIASFGKKIDGFDAPDAVLTGAETRTSAPLRILRNNDTRLAIGFNNLYPAGEGAGYAGGITSAAIDGLKCAMALMSVYKPYSDV